MTLMRFRQSLDRLISSFTPSSFFFDRLSNVLFLPLIPISTALSTKRATNERSVMKKKIPPKKNNHHYQKITTGINHKTYTRHTTDETLITALRISASSSTMLSTQPENRYHVPATFFILSASIPCKGGSSEGDAFTSLSFIFIFFL